MTQFVGKVEVASVDGRTSNGAFTFMPATTLVFNGDDKEAWSALEQVVRHNVEFYDMRGTGQAAFHTGVLKVAGKYVKDGVEVLAPKSVKEFLTHAQEVSLLPPFNVGLHEFSTVGVSNMTDSIEGLAVELVESLENMDTTQPCLVVFEEVLVENAVGVLVGGGAIKKLKNGLRIGEQLIVDQAEGLWNVASLVANKAAVLDKLEVVAVLEGGETINMQAEGEVATANLINLMMYQNEFEPRLSNNVETLLNNLYSASARVLDNSGGTFIESGMVIATKDVVTDESEDVLTTTFVMRNNKVRRFQQVNARKPKVTDITVFDLIKELRELKAEQYKFAIASTEQSMYEVGYAAIAVRTKKGTEYFDNLGGFIGQLKQDVTSNVEREMGAELEALTQAALAIQESIGDLKEKFGTVTGYVDSVFSNIPDFQIEEAN